MLMTMLQHFRNQKGQGMVEYGLILALVSIAVIVVLTAMGTQLDTLFQSVKTALTPAS